MLFQNPPTELYGIVFALVWPISTCAKLIVNFWLQRSREQGAGRKACNLRVNIQFILSKYLVQQLKGFANLFHKVNHKLEKLGKHTTTSLSILK